MSRADALWRRRKLVLAVWALVAIVALPMAALQGEHLVGGGFENREAQSWTVEQALDGNEFGGTQLSPLAAVLIPRQNAGPSDLQKAVDEVSGQVAETGGAQVARPERRAALESAGGRPDRPVIMALDLKGNQNLSETIDLARELRKDLGIEQEAAGRAAGGRVNVHLVGQAALWTAFQKTAEADARQAEGRAFPVIALVLLFVFGSVAASMLPLMLGGLAIVITGAIVFILSQVTLMSLFVASIVSLLGIGIAIDYSLFVLVRYREEIKAGREPSEARAVAMATSGRAVVFSGITVLLSLCALFLIPSAGVRSVAVGAITVVAVSVVGAATLMPVLMGILGKRAYEPGRLGRWLERRRAGRVQRPEDRFWARWSRTVMRHPVVSLVVASGALLALASTALDMRVHNSATRQLPDDHEIRDGVSAVSEVLGPGALGPAYVRVGFEEGNATDAAGGRKLSELSMAIEADRGIAYVNPPRQSDDGGAALLIAVPTSGPESSRARDTVARLREELPKVAGEDVTIDVGGVTATMLDFDRLATKSLWRPVVFVLVLSFLVLLVVLRSVLLPLKATIMNALSIGAAYGALVGVFQHGWLEFIGIDRSPEIYPLTMPLVLAGGFGLSMDYHIFLLSRIRERYLATGDNRRAVAEALTASATAITSAALIMVVVFMAFVSSAVPSVQQLGFAAAVAIGVDATLVRLVIVPAAMELLGKWNWWMPRTLDRLLPTPGDLAVALDRVPVSAAVSRPEASRSTS